MFYNLPVKLRWLCMYCESLLTANAISGLVKERYCKLPTTFLYCVALHGLEPSSRTNFVDDAFGIETSLASCILVMSRTSLM